MPDEPVCSCLIVPGDWGNHARTRRIPDPNCQVHKGS